MAVASGENKLFLAVRKLAPRQKPLVFRTRAAARAYCKVQNEKVRQNMQFWTVYPAVWGPD